MDAFIAGIVCRFCHNEISAVFKNCGVKIEYPGTLVCFCGTNQNITCSAILCSCRTINDITCITVFSPVPQADALNGKIIPGFCLYPDGSR